MKYMIWDLDNCLADDKWRTCFVDYSLAGDARWAPYNERLLADKPNPEAVRVYEALFVQGIRPIFSTGRSEVFRKATEAWLDAHGFWGWNEGGIYMRRVGDERSAPELKAENLQKIRETGGEAAFAFDDLPEVVHMYLEQGVAEAKLLQCHPPKEVYRQTVSSRVAQERRRQDDKWGGPAHDDRHTPGEFYQLIEDYTRWSRTMSKIGSEDKAHRRLVQVSALAQAAAESLERKHPEMLR